MAEHAALKKALRQMAEGSKSAFHTFYLGTSQYIYSSALLLYDSHEDACRFMVDFYQYLYLHLPEYDRSGNLEGWISRLLLERYEQLSIGKNMPKPSVEKQMDSATAQLSKSEQERVWRMLDVNIHFPKEPVRRSFRSIALLVSVLLLLILIASRYMPCVLEQLQTSNASGESENISGEPGESENAANEDTGSADSGQEDELDSIKDAIESIANERSNSGSGNEGEDTDDLQMQQQSGISEEADQSGAPESPQEPDAPQEPESPQEPQTPQTPEMSEDSDSPSGADDLENLELELHYGDQLRF